MFMSNKGARELVFDCDVSHVTLQEHIYISRAVVFIYI